MGLRLIQNTIDGSGHTPLKIAITEGHLEIVKALLASKANVHAEGKPPPPA
jgi:ankyrin repeat protein